MGLVSSTPPPGALPAPQIRATPLITPHQRKHFLNPTTSWLELLGSKAFPELARRAIFQTQYEHDAPEKYEHGKVCAPQNALLSRRRSHALLRRPHSLVDEATRPSECLTLS